VSNVRGEHGCLARSADKTMGFDAVVCGGG
jgi:hypothetical protein